MSLSVSPCVFQSPVPCPLVAHGAQTGMEHCIQELFRQLRIKASPFSVVPVLELSTIVDITHTWTRSHYRGIGSIRCKIILCGGFYPVTCRLAASLVSVP